MLNKERVRLLVEALRSGKYHQGNSALEFTDNAGVVRNCCLGVGCRVALENGLEITTGESNDFVFLGERKFPKTRFYGPGEWGDSNYMPESVREWFGFASSDPLVSTPDDGLSASEANDDKELSFEEIADAFERTYLREDN